MLLGLRANFRLLLRFQWYLFRVAILRKNFHRYRIRCDILLRVVVRMEIYFALANSHDGRIASPNCLRWLQTFRLVVTDGTFDLDFTFMHHGVRWCEHIFLKVTISCAWIMRCKYLCFIMRLVFFVGRLNQAHHLFRWLLHVLKLPLILTVCLYYRGHLLRDRALLLLYFEFAFLYLIYHFLILILVLLWYLLLLWFFGHDRLSRRWDPQCV